MKRTFTSIAAISLLLTLRCGAGEIHDAVLKRDLTAVERLLKKDRSLIHAHTFPDFKTPLAYAVGIGDAAIVRRLLAAGADLQAQDAGGLTPLLRASVIATESAHQGNSRSRWRGYRFGHCVDCIPTRFLHGRRAVSA